MREAPRNNDIPSNVGTLLAMTSLPLIQDRTADAESAGPAAGTNCPSMEPGRGGQQCRDVSGSAAPGSSSSTSAATPSQAGGGRRARAASPPRRRPRALCTSSSATSKEGATPIPSGSPWPTTSPAGSTTNGLEGSARAPSTEGYVRREVNPVIGGLEIARVRPGHIRLVLGSFSFRPSPCDGSGLHPDTRLHDVRHAVATELGRRGVQPVIVSAVLGHTSPSFTIAVYQHAWQEGPSEAARALEAALGPLGRWQSVGTGGHRSVQRRGDDHESAVRRVGRGGLEPPTGGL